MFLNLFLLNFSDVSIEAVPFDKTTIQLNVTWTPVDLKGEYNIVSILLFTLDSYYYCLYV